jgi:hypothetical protein
MIIQRSDMLLQASHLYQLRRTTDAQGRAWVGQRPPADGAAATAALSRPAAADPAPPEAVGAAAPPPTRAPAAVAALSAAVTHARWSAAAGSAVLAAAARACTGRVPGGPEEPGELGRTGHAVQGRLATIVALIEWLTGQRVQVLDPADLGERARNGQDADRPAAAAASGASVSPAPAASARNAAGWGLEVSGTETTVEKEATAVSAAGSVTTADGRVIDVAVDVGLSREVSRTSAFRLTAGDAAVTDPLMLTFTGAPGLGTERAAFDLNGDGVNEQLPDAGDGSAFLVVDRNGNGLLDDGTELLGPATGDGFGELAAYDRDGNGWIDEADPVFTRLGLATTAHGALTSLADRNVGAIGLAHVASPFTFTAGDQISGFLRSMGVWLGEDGSAGTVQQTDVAS